MVDLGKTARAGDRLETLIEVRDKLADELQDAYGKDAATVAKELRAVMAEIDSLVPVKEGSRFDELAARREARLADAEDQAGSAGQ